ncbi:CAP domain-containing protein [Listeria monocytogenes]|nr:CAP domain-containing protein [Listeria monocytogenes]
MKPKFKTLIVITLSILVLNILTPVATFAATWNGVAGVSDAVVNSITAYENEAASYNSQIATLTWSIDMNQGTIDAWTANLQKAQAATASGNKQDVWYGREAECQEYIDNNRNPMLQRIAERNQLYAKQNQALANAANARAQAAAITANNNAGNANGGSTGGNTSNSGSTSSETWPSETIPSETVPSETAPSESTKPSESTEESKTPGKDKDKDKNKDKDKTEESKPKPDKPKDESEAGEIVIDNKDEIKDELNDFDHSKSVEELIKENKNGTYTVTEEAMRKAILDKINMYRVANGLKSVQVSDALVDYAASKAEDHKNGLGHWDTEKTRQEEANILDIFSNVLYVTNDLATFQSDFDSREVNSMEKAFALADKIAEGIVGEYGGFLSDGHKFDILDPNAWLANLILTSKQEAYTDVWTGQTKYTTVWYLAYVYTATK